MHRCIFGSVSEVDADETSTVDSSGSDVEKEAAPFKAPRAALAWLQLPSGDRCSVLEHCGSKGTGCAELSLLPPEADASLQHFLSSDLGSDYWPWTP